MATLTAASAAFKKTFYLFLLAIVAIIGLLIAIRMASGLKNAFFPPASVPATVAFDKLPEADLAEGEKIPSDIVYKIETISGDLPKLANMAKVFKIERGVFSFGDVAAAGAIAGGVGFVDQPVEVTGGRVKFLNPMNQSRQIIMDLTDGNFALGDDYLTDSELVLGPIKTEEDTIKSVYDFFANFNLAQADFPQDKAQVTKYALRDAKLVEVDLIAGANLLKIALFRGDVDKLQVINSTEEPHVWAVANGSNIMEAKRQTLPIKLHKFSTYPLKSTEKAYKELKAREGALNRKPNGKLFVIRNIALGYVETQKVQDYLQPFYLFKGDNDTVAYVPAVEQSWIQMPN